MAVAAIFARAVCKNGVRAKDVDPSGTASEFLSVGPLIRKWLEDVVKPKGICIAHVTSLLLAISVTDLLLQVNTGCINPRMLANALARHYAAHIIAYGFALFKPKHHFMLHLPEQLEYSSFLISCFVHERKHKIIKRWAVPMCTGNNVKYDRGLLEECTRAHVEALKEPLLKPCLIETRPADPKVVATLRAQGFASAESALTGRTARVQGRTIAVGDVVLYAAGDGSRDVHIGEVYFHASLDHHLLVGLANWPV